MANNLSKQILEDGPRNVVVKLAGVLDTSNVIWTPAISLSDLQNNDPIFGTLVGLRVMSVDYSSGPGLVTRLEWQSGSPQLIGAYSMSEDTNYSKGGGFVPNRQIAGYNGAINLVTQGYVAGGVQGFTLVVRLAKIYSQTGL